MTPPADPNGAVDPVAAPIVDPSQTTLPVQTEEGGDPTDVTPSMEELSPEDLAVLEITPDSVSQDGRLHFYNPTKSQRLQAEHKLVRDLTQVIPDLSVDSVKALHENAMQFSDLMNTYREGGESIDAMDRVLDRLHQTDPYAFGGMAIRALQVLPQANPDAAKAVDQYKMGQFLSNARARISQISDPAARDAEVAFVQNLEMRWTGRYTPKQDLLQATQVDPVAAERQRTIALERQLQQIQQQNQNTQRQVRMQSIDAAEDAAVNGSFDSVLAPLRANTAFKPEDIQVLQREFTQALQDAEASNPTWAATYKQLRMDAERTGTPDAAQKVANYRRQIADIVVRQNRQRIISSRSQLVAATNQAAHTQAAQAPRTENAPNGAVAPAPNGSLEAASKAKTWDDMNRAMGWSR